jgi:hypothetical protein
MNLFQQTTMATEKQTLQFLETGLGLYNNQLLDLKLCNLGRRAIN